MTETAMLDARDEKILDTFKGVLPSMTAETKDRLSYFAEGLAMGEKRRRQKEEQERAEAATAPVT